MEEQQGVTEAVETPTPQETSPVSEPGEIKTEQSSVKTDELPFGKHPRWIKLNEANRNYKAKIKDLESRLGTLSEAEKLDQWLRSDPQNLKTVLDLMSGPKEASKDPYQGYDPETAQLLRDRDARIQALEQKFSKLEEMEQNSKLTSKQKNEKALESEFSRMLQEKGFTNDQGLVPDDSAPLVALVEKATLAELMSIAEDPNFPSKEELNQAFTNVTMGLEVAKKFGLKDVIKNVPPTGSKLGTPPPKGPMSEAERIRQMAQEWNGQI